jgi:hypothetical protein
MRVVLLSKDVIVRTKFKSAIPDLPFVAISVGLVSEITQSRRLGFEVYCWWFFL